MPDGGTWRPDTPRGLKQRHGKSRIVVRREDGDEIALPFSEEDTPERLATALRAGDVQSVSTEESTLEEVFLKLTGKALQ